MFIRDLLTNQTITLQPGDTLTVNVPAAAPIPVARTWGVLSGDDNQITPVNCAALAAKGVRSLTVSAFPDRMQPMQGYDVKQSGEWPAFIGRLSAAKGVGLKVNLSIAYHYPPAWALTAIPKLRDSVGQTWSGTHSMGDEVRDWIWSSVGQSYISDFFTRVLKGIAMAGLTDVIGSIRLGSGPYGEVCYPRPGRWDGGTVTSAIHPPQPTPGLARDQWYLDSQSRYIVWLVGVIRAAGWQGPIYVLHPSFGIRSDWATNDPNYVVEFNAGCDPKRYIAAYKGLPNVWPYATWLEDTDRANPIVKDSDKASWRKVLDEAKAAGLPCWGENAHSDIGQAGMDLMFDGAVKAGIGGINWLHRESLLPLLDHYVQRIAAA